MSDKPKIEVLPIEQGATPDPQNVNKHTQRGRGLHENSMRKRGAGRSIFSAGKGVEVPVTIGGNQTLEIAASLGMDVINVHTTGNQIVNVVRDDIEPGSPEFYALAIEDNEVAKQSYNPDIDILAAVMADPAMQALKAEDKMLADIVDGMGLKEEAVNEEPQITTDRFEEVQKKWDTADGQLWQVGNHFVYCGDSLDSVGSDIVLRGEIPALIFADPPYGVNIVASNVSVGGGESNSGMIPFGGKKRGYVGGGAEIKARTGFYPIEKKFRGTVGSSKPFGSKAERGSDGAAQIVDVGKYPVIIGDENTDTAKRAVALYCEKYPDAYQAWWGANYYIEALKPSPCWLVWNKETTGNFADCELAWVNADMSAKLFTHRWNGMLRDSEREKRWHPTQKPSALAEWGYGLFTDKGDIVLDPFGGAGWTLLAAERTGRSARIIEKSAEYIAVQLERMSTAFPALEIKRIE